MHTEQLERMRHGRGFVAALDQSGGSTPAALAAYGLGAERYANGDQMFDLMHQMRSRMIESPSFTGEHILGAILFEDTMNREIEGVRTSEYLWTQKSIVPFLKVDKGLAAQVDGVQLMKPTPEIEKLLDRAIDNAIFGTKMRSVIKSASPTGISAVMTQQFELARVILTHGLIPIVEPEVDIYAPDKAAAEQILRQEIRDNLKSLPKESSILLKLTLPSVNNFYEEFVDDARIIRVLALSGGYSRDEADGKLAANRGVIASFSRALTEGLTAGQSEAEFNSVLCDTIDEVQRASAAPDFVE